MDKQGDLGTDGASIKPVSSLLAQFEGLRTKPPQTPGQKESKSNSTPISRQVNEVLRPTPFRSSFDIPRPSSAWTTGDEDGKNNPQTPHDQQRSNTSPTRSSHKRPLSMQIQPLPQLVPTPAVTVESPRSPPHMLFERSISQSPERVDNTSVRKVRDLISHHSSRASTRPTTPAPGGDVSTTTRGGSEKEAQVAAHALLRGTSPARVPPPVNRADKPKVPTKPLTMSIAAAGAGQLTTETIPTNPDPKYSPFSTPPSSEEQSRSGSPPPGPSPFSPEEIVTSPESEEAPSTPGFNCAIPPQLSSAPAPSGYNEPFQTRGLGVVATPRSLATDEQKDPRSLGFSSSSVHPPRRNSRSPAPTRSNTVVEKTRDARSFGFASRSTPRAVSENIRGITESNQLNRPQYQAALPAAVPQRDARQFGFSPLPMSASSQDPEHPPRLPTRAPGGAPPRPSDDSKPVSSKTAPLNNPATGRASEPGTQPTSQSMAAPPPPDISFPPPPRRNTAKEEEPQLRGPSPAAPSLPSRSATFDASHSQVKYDPDLAEKVQEPFTARSDYPDATQTNRRPPFIASGQQEIPTRSDGRVFDICGSKICVAGYITRIFDVETGEQVMSLNHGDTVKITAAKFKPGQDIGEEGSHLWLGNNAGDLVQVDLRTHSEVARSSAHNRREIVKILRCRRSLWTLDDDGKLLVWRGDQGLGVSLKHDPIHHKVAKGHTFSMVVQDKLWLATGREIRIYKPGNELSFTALTSPLSQPRTGDITSGAVTTAGSGRAYFGHADGKITIYSTTNFSYLGSVQVSDYKITALAFVGNYLWAAYKTGKVYVYDVSTTPWKVKKDWPAHTGPAYGMVLDPSSVWTMQKLQVATAGHDNVVRLWDATLEEDWMECAMQESDVHYCTFRELRAAVVTWNVGAITPSVLRSDFIADAIHADDPPEILAFGFQEVVDLEDKAITAKSLLGFGKKKKEDVARHEQHQSRVYREWRDYLARFISRFTDGQYVYTELNTSSLIGLFQCIFIRQDERRNISMLSATNVKCGMGGHYGNKGALVTRFVLDDSSLCFVNCHLAAGQTQTSHRNNDIATILESESLPAELNRQVRSCLFVGGGDGTQILDHEICILNGDLNYRIDAVPRDTVIKMIRNNELAKLLERDQIMVSRRRVSGFRLSSFTELPITFAPTYKYDPGTDNYDSSEKKRSPAWCDRILYRGPGRVKQVEYRRHEVRHSDHRPVSGVLKLRVKKVDPERQEATRLQHLKNFKVMKRDMAEKVCMRWLVDVMGLSERDAQAILVS